MYTVDMELKSMIST